MSKVLLGMSGGIDSSVAALLLHEQGYEVVGVTFIAYEQSVLHKGGTPEEVEAAGDVCRFLGIEHRVVDWRREFRRDVMEPFFNEYQMGRTPNPCMRCNRFIKFGLLADMAAAEDAFVATGHYTALRDGLICRGEDPKKDQSYFLAMVRPAVLPRLLFPLAGYSKERVRALAAEANLPVAADKGESQDICFVPDDYREVLRENGVAGKPGGFLLDGRLVGEHEGIPFYTIGQRRGLRVAAGRRIYVRRLDAESNTIELGQKPLAREFTVADLNRFQSLEGEDLCVQIRYGSRPLAVAQMQEAGDGRWRVVLKEPAALVTPGQYAVFYRDDTVAAGSVIQSVDLLPE